MATAGSRSKTVDQRRNNPFPTGTSTVRDTNIPTPQTGDTWLLDNGDATYTPQAFIANAWVNIGGPTLSGFTNALIPEAAGPVYVQERTFTETTGAGTYTATVAVPAGHSVLDVLVINTALWTATTSADMTIGDGGDADGYFASFDLKTVPGVITGGAYGLNLHDDGGAYTDGKYLGSAYTITITAVTVGAAGNAGRTRVLVLLARNAASVVAANKV